jgi:hypothetical protein
MSTPSQIEANRRNAAKSGCPLLHPTSVDGKALPSMNALQSSIHAESAIITSEDPAALDHLTETFYHDHQAERRAQPVQQPAPRRVARRNCRSFNTSGSNWLCSANTGKWLRSATKLQSEPRPGEGGTGLRHKAAFAFYPVPEYIFPLPGVAKWSFPIGFVSQTRALARKCETHPSSAASLESSCRGSRPRMRRPHRVRFRGLLGNRLPWLIMGFVSCFSSLPARQDVPEAQKNPFAGSANASDAGRKIYDGASGMYGNEARPMESGIKTKPQNGGPERE